MTRKTVFLATLLGICSACSNTQDVTLSELTLGKDFRPSDTTVQEMLFDKDCTDCKKKSAPEVEVINVQEVEVEGVDITPHRLPKTYERPVFVEPTPEVYAIAANRAINKMLDETADIYDAENNAIYIGGTQLANETLPNGYYNAAKIIENITRNSQTFKVVDKSDEADYILKSTIDKSGTKEQPVVVYKLSLFDKNGDKTVGEWVETLRPMINDDGSWW